MVISNWIFPIKFSLSITGNTPYVFALNGVRAVKDVEFISDDLAVKYSDFFSEDLMEASETLDTADLFN